jgi:hypothetical protein
VFFTPIKLSKHRAKTPEGFLIVSGCAIARTGFQLYSELEIDVPPGPDGLIRIERDPEEVFAKETMASAEGKDIVDDHPGVDVVPENWKSLSLGHMQNVRRGEGVEDHLLLADLVFKDPDAIRMIESNPEHELSCGYESQYEVYGAGRAAQRNIRINHVAIVKQGRCGPACKTRDSGAMVRDLMSVSEGVPTHPKCSDILCTCGVETTTKTKDSGMSRMTDWLSKVKDALTRDDKAALAQHVADAESIMKLTGNPGAAEHEQHIHLHLGGPETTKPEGGLPETGETRVAHDHQVGGDPAATFEGRTFFADSSLNEAFHAHMKGMKDSIEGVEKMCKDGFEEMKKHFEGKAEDNMAEHAKAAGTMVDSVEGEEPAHEKANRPIEGELKEEAPQYTGDVKKVKDSAILVDSFADTVRDAAILVPEIAVPTFDSKLPAAEGYAAVCGLRKKALTQYAATEDGKKVLSQITRTLDFAGCSCREVTTMFRGAVAVRKAQLATADMRGFKDGEKVEDSKSAATGPKTTGDWQALIDAHYAAQAAAAAE